MFASLAGLASGQPRVGLWLTAPASLAALTATLVWTATPAAVDPAEPAVVRTSSLDVRPTVNDVRKLISDERPTAAFEAALLAIEDTPDDPELFDLAAQAAFGLGKEDEALWYSRLGVRELLRLEDVPKDLQPLLARLQARQLELDPQTAVAQELLDDYAKESLRLASSAKGSKLFVNATEMFLRLMGTASEDRAKKELDKIYDDDDASETLFLYGFELPPGKLRGVLKNKPASQIAREDEAHSKWKDRYELKEKRPPYRVETNMGQVEANRIMNAMQQVNGLITEALGLRTTKQECKIRVFSSFEEWNEVESEAIGRPFTPSTGGFFLGVENRISTYDQSTVGRAYSQLWKTLFHEATHQIATELSDTLLPAWIEEGNACYFEGVELLPTDRLVSNLVPESRLRYLLLSLGAKPDSYRQPWEGVPKVGGGLASEEEDEDTTTTAYRSWLGNPASRPDMASFPAPADSSVRIKEVITYFQPGSYDGQFYPWGWGLIYFLRNYEDANGERIYSPILDKYIKTYHKRRDHNVWERFMEHFVYGPDREGVEDFDDFYGMWAQWIWDLGDLYYGGPEAADPLYHRALVQVEQGNEDRAAETLRWALEKRPGDPQILMEFANVQADLKNKDEAIYALRRTLAWARRQPEPKAEVAGTGLSVEELEAECFERIGKVNSKLTKGAKKIDDAFMAQSIDLANEYADQDYPLRGVMLMDEAIDLMGSVYAMTSVRETLADTFGVDPRLRRRMSADMHADKWGGNLGFMADGANLELLPLPGVQRAVWMDELPLRYRFEGKLEAGSGMVIDLDGLSEDAIGGGFEIGSLMYGWKEGEGFGRIEELTGEEGGLRLAEKFADEERGNEYPVAFEVSEGLVRVYLDDELIAEDVVSDSATRGRAGIWGSSTMMTFENLYIVY